MYKNRTIYDLELLLLSQQGMLKQTRIVSAVFTVIILALGIVCLIAEKLMLGIALIIAAVLVLVLFVALCGWFLKLTMQKNLQDRKIEIEFLFSNNLTITSYVDGRTSTQSFEYNNIYQIVENDDCLLINQGGQDALIMRKDEEFDNYRNFVMEKMQGRYVVKLKKKTK